MRSFLEIFLGNFWYMVAIATVVNVFVYRRVFEMRCENEDLAREAFGSFRWIALFGALLFLGLGGLQTVGGFVTPVFPFIIPTRGSLIVSTSWAIVILANLGLVFYLSSIERRIAEEIARVLLANLVEGRLGFVIVRTSIIVGVIAMIGIPCLLAMIRGEAAL